MFVFGGGSTYDKILKTSRCGFIELETTCIKLKNLELWTILLIPC